jgi:hypothetical protein
VGGEKGRDVARMGIHYSPFEKTRISAPAQRFPDLAPKLDRLKARLFDLLPVIRNGYYNREFEGSYSIKKVLPALVPDMSYDCLEIADGDTAIALFARMAMGQYSAAEVGRTREELLKYCHQDTLAMVKLHEALMSCA